MKIALGTVQFGMEYGVANTAGRVSHATVKSVLKIAHTLGVDILDTAAAYGDSEYVLGNAGVSSFKIISKVPSCPRNTENPANWLKDCVDKSLTNLRSDTIYGMLLHRPLDLLGPNGHDLYEALLSVKRQGLVEKIGASVYGPDDLDQLETFGFDIVQAPMNILDRRLENSGWLRRLNESNTEVHVRSAFLQGLLLIPEGKRPEYFRPWENLLTGYEAWLKDQNLSSLQACLGYLNARPEIDKIVVGVETPRQLQEIASAVSTPLPSIPESIQTDDLKLINPAMWAL